MNEWKFSDLEYTRPDFEEVKAPRKAFYLMHDMTHALLEAQPEAFSKYVHEIAKLEKEAKIN